MWAGRHRRSAWETLCSRYEDRIAQTIPIRQVAVKSRVAASDPRRLVIEGESLLAVLPDPCWIVALDRRGKARDSTRLSHWLTKLRRDWPHPVAFLLGSDLGLDTGVLGTARETLSLGPLTLPHELARLVLCEQLYRALSIEVGIKYHRQPL